MSVHREGARAWPSIDFTIRRPFMPRSATRMWSKRPDPAGPSMFPARSASPPMGKLLTIFAPRPSKASRNLKKRACCGRRRFGARGQDHRLLCRHLRPRGFQRDTKQHLRHQNTAGCDSRADRQARARRAIIRNRGNRGRAREIISLAGLMSGSRSLFVLRRVTDRHENLLFVPPRQRPCRPGFRSISRCAARDIAVTCASRVGSASDWINLHERCMVIPPRKNSLGATS